MVRSRTELRDQARRQDKLFEARSKLAALEPGGSPARPLEVSSASVVEARAEAERCLRCELPLRALSHDTRDTERGLVRVVGLRCRGCGETRDVYVRIVEKLLN